MSLTMKVTRGAESWQFFAFVFAALVALLLAIVDDLPCDTRWGWKLATKVAIFVLTGYFTLVNVSVRNWLVWLLGVFKDEHM